jgi:hypothetical protein
MDTLNKIGTWYLLKEKLRHLFKPSQKDANCSFGHTTFSSKEPMKDDAYQKDKKNLNI